jgi:hypothetical protein
MFHINKSNQVNKELKTHITLKTEEYIQRIKVFENKHGCNRKIIINNKEITVNTQLL